MVVTKAMVTITKRFNKWLNKMINFTYFLVNEQHRYCYSKEKRRISNDYTWKNERINK